ncbi:MAG TPA: MSMEG_0565 family glycosyltransferase [Albitalea sp.]|uniref:MSMEG_0565 family glycosyltransferase n=1 Tax=Piscinibacter sp. TaxID=1903157 RepID=UPI002ED68C01
MNVALLTHSVNPRGGVVHVLELGRALQARGHEVTVIAPASPGQRFFRATPCHVELASVPPAAADLAETVRERVVAVREHLGKLLRRASFDVFHAHDGIGANALADLVEQGLIPSYLRTVHHVDRFADPRVQSFEARSIRRAAQVLCVSAVWHERLRAEHGVHAQQVPNGIDLDRFTLQACPDDAQVLRRLGLGAGHPVVLSVGGIEARKNTRRLLQAFVMFRKRHPDARLVIAGGASLLNHDAETAAFRTEAAAEGLAVGPGATIVITGPIADADMPALYRGADVVAMPSLVEGFGLAALEALASGTPTVVSGIAPFTEHFTDGEVSWADPLQPASIAEALHAALVRGRHHEVPAVCRRFAWSASAACHEALYRVAKST